MRQLDTAVVSGGRSRGLGDARTRQETRLAGRVTGLLYLTGVIGAVALLLLPGPALQQPGYLVGAAVAGLIWGVASIWWLEWDRLPRWVSYASTSGGLVIVAVVFLTSAATAAPALMWLALIVAFSAFFYPWRITVVFVTSCLVLGGVLLAEHPDAFGEANGPRVIAIGATVLAIAGFLISTGRYLLVQLRDDADSLGAAHRRLADEQSALRRVATAVAAGSPPSAVFALVASEIGRLAEADAAAVTKLMPGEQAMVMGSWSRRDHPRHEPGTIVPVASSPHLRMLRAADGPIRSRRDDPEPDVPLGYEVLVTAPIQVDSLPWGGLSVVSTRLDGLPAGAEDRLRDFAALAATAIANAEDRARLATLAASDPLTGLANHRIFQERLRAEVSRARRHSRPVVVALLDVDHFGDLNDRTGHEAGDAVLAEVAGVLRAVARNEDVLARLGGDEFALLLPETDSHSAYGVCERIRAIVADTAFRHRERLTISAGVCDLHTAGDPDAMYRFAQGALYWSKAHGRNVTWIYDPSVVRELNAAERAEQLERSHALTGLRALARAVDAKDATTAEHSERVAALAGRLAAASGWSPQRIAQLTEAALVHDVGKIGVPDAILLKPGSLTEDEYELVKGHVTLGVQIVGDVLSAEQIRWLETHHERPDGGGYPRGFGARDIPEGGALLALADAWDVMTCARSYGRPVTPEVATAEIDSLVGRQFTSAAVEALHALHADGDLQDVAERLHRPAPQGAASDE